MKYKTKDKVIIRKAKDKVIIRKAKEEKEEEEYKNHIEKILDDNNYILTVKEFKKNQNGHMCYIMEETRLVEWDERYIKGLYIKPEPIVSRFEILDL